MYPATFAERIHMPLVKYLVALLLPVFMVSCSKPQPPNAGIAQSWLFGTWISDREATYQHMVDQTSMDAETAKNIADTVFGFCEITITDSKVKMYFPPSCPMGEYSQESTLDILHASDDQVVPVSYTHLTLPTIPLV